MLHVKLLIISILFLGCISDPEKETDIKSVTDTLYIAGQPITGDSVLVRYNSSAHDMDVFYCQEDGTVTVEFNTRKFEKELYIAAGERACISVVKLNEDNDMDAQVFIYIGDSLVVSESGEMRASASVEL